MSMKINERVVGSVTILDVVGKLVLGEPSQLLKDKIDSLIAQQRTRVLLNLKHVPYIDSSGLGQLAASYGAVMKSNGALKLLSVGERNHDLLSITRLVTLFDSFESETEALQSFSGVAPVVA